MSNIYIINNTSGEALFAIQPKATNGPGAAGHNTDLTLYGYGAPNWGERFNENFYRLLENFACAEKEPGDTGYDALNPSPKGEGDVGITEKYGVNKPVLGQTWFNTTQDKLFVCTQVDPTVVWTPIASDDTSTAYVSKTGDTMSGFLTLHSSPVENMHAATKQYVDTGVASMAALFVRKSGDTMNTGQTLVLGRDPVGNMDAVTKQYVDAVAGTPGPINDPVKIGTVVPFAGTTTPENWLPCYGQAVSRTTYNELFGVIGITYGAGDGTTTFNLPDFRGRMPVGPDNYGGTAANVITNAQGDVLGGKYGAEFHTLTLNEIPSHTHTGSVNSAGSHTHQGYFPFQGGTQVSSGSGWGNNFLDTSANGAHTHTVTINSAGTDAAHNNVQPSLTMYYIIKAKPEQTTIGGVSGDYVARGGDSMYGSLTMTGATDITLARAPTLPMHAVNKQYVDNCCSGASGTGEPTWTYRTTITTATLLSTASYVNCGSTPTFTVPGTGTRKCIISAHVPIDVYGYPNQIFIRMLLDGIVVDHNSFNISVPADAPHSGQALSFSYTGDISAGPHTVSFQGKLDTTSTLESGDWVRVNGSHSPSSNTNVDAYTRVDVFVDGTGTGVSAAELTGLTFVPASITSVESPILLDTGTITRTTGTGWYYTTDYAVTLSSAPTNATHVMVRAKVNTNAGGNNTVVGQVKIPEDTTWITKLSTDPTGDGTTVAWEGEAWATFTIPFNVATKMFSFRLGINRETGSTTSTMSAVIYLEGYFIDENAAGVGGSNSFGTISVAGQSSVIADTPMDTLTLAAGTGITLTTNAASDTVTISSTGGGGSTEPSWTYRTTITTVTSLTSTTTYANCGSTTFTVPGTLTRNCIIVAHVPVEVIGYPYQIFVRMLLDDVAVDHNSFNINPSGAGAREGHNLTFSYAGNLTPGSHTISFQGKITSGQALSSGYSVYVNHGHVDTGGTDPDTYMRVDVFVEGMGGGTTSATVDVSADENYIINGNFDIWERMSAYSASAGALVAPPTSFTITGPSQKKYTADRWLIASLTTGTCSCTVTRIAATPGEVKGYKQYDLQWTIPNTTSRLYLAQRIEHVSSLSDGEITVSFVAKQTAGAPTPLNVRLVQYFGTSGSPSVTVTSSPVTISATMQLHTVTLSLPSISGKTIGAGNFLEVAFQTPETVSGVTYVFSRVQVEEGAAATKYKYRSVGTELDLCTRYFQHGYFGESKNAIPYIAGVNALTNETWVPFPTRMRAVPTFSHAFAWGGQQGVYPENGGNIGYGTTTDGPFAVSVQPVGVQIQFAGFTAFPTSGGDASLAGWWQADAEL